MVQNLDLAPTFLEAAGIKIPKDIQGESIVPLLKGGSKFRKAAYYHYYEYPGIHAVKRHYAIVKEDFKLIHFYHDVNEWELFDRKNDPNEMTNVYYDPKYKKIRSKLHRELNALRKKYKDSNDLDRHFIEITTDEYRISRGKLDILKN
jgi:arylsulfatase A-like enzyme